MAEGQLASSPKAPVRVAAPSEGLVILNADALVARVEAIHDILDRVMIEGVHYHAFGTSKKKVRENGVVVEKELPNYSLGKAGAETICLTFAMTPDIESLTVVDDPNLERLIQVGEWVTDPAARNNRRKEMRDVKMRGIYEVKSTCSVWGHDGRLLARASGSCSNAEASFQNQAYADAKNGVLKRAEKRAMVAAVLMASGASDLFTQDLEDGAGDVLPGSEGSGSSQPPKPAGWLSEGQVRLLFGKAKAKGIPQEVTEYVVARLNHLGVKVGKPHFNAIADGLPAGEEVWAQAKISVGRGLSPTAEQGAGAAAPASGQPASDGSPAGAPDGSSSGGESPTA